MESWSRFHRSNRHLKGQVLLEIKQRRCLPCFQQGSLAGQAILELAIFGSILIMLLGILVNYGLRYSQQQKTMQQAFRKALASAARSMSPGTPVSVQHVLVRERHIPNPTDAFGFGSVLSASAGSSSPTRSYALEQTPDTEAELPHLLIDVQGQEFLFKTAAFREEDNVLVSSKDRYIKVYGEVWGCTGFDGGGNCTGWRILAEGEEPNNPENEKEAKIVITPDDKIARIRFIDSCAGEIVDYNSAVKQCRLIVDSEACRTECLRIDGKNCAATCSQDISIPLYCGTKPGTNPATDYEEIDSVNHRYRFPVLEQIFAFAKGERKMGIQDDYTQTVTQGNKLDKKETTADIATTDTLDWQTQTKRTLVNKTYGETSTSTNKTDIVTSVPANKKRTSSWQTPW